MHLGSWGRRIISLRLSWAVEYPGEMGPRQEGQRESHSEIILTMKESTNSFAVKHVLPSKHP